MNIQKSQWHAQPWLYGSALMPSVHCTAPDSAIVCKYVFDTIAITAHLISAKP